MLNSDDINQKLKLILASEYYEGDFGDTIADIKLILSNVDDKDIKKSIPTDYVEFIQKFGFGELDESFYIEDGPAPYEDIYKSQIDKLKGSYVIASDMSEFSYLIDSSNGWRVIQVDSQGGPSGIVYENFSVFIDNKLDEIVSAVKWRIENF